MLLINSKKGIKTLLWAFFNTLLLHWTHTIMPHHPLFSLISYFNVCSSYKTQWRLWLFDHTPCPYLLLSTLDNFNYHKNPSVIFAFLLLDLLIPMMTYFSLSNSPTSSITLYTTRDSTTPEIIDSNIPLSAESSLRFVCCSIPETWSLRLIKTPFIDLSTSFQPICHLLSTPFSFSRLDVIIYQCNYSPTVFYIFWLLDFYCSNLRNNFFGVQQISEENHITRWTRIAMNSWPIKQWSFQHVLSLLNLLSYFLQWWIHVSAV